MWTLIRNGGVPPMLFILLTGLVGLAAAFHFALRARRQSLGFIKKMALATLYAAEKSFEQAASEAEALPRVTHIVVEGLAESTSPGILGFSFLALTAMLVAVGRRRLDERTGEALARGAGAG